MKQQYCNVNEYYCVLLVYAMHVNVYRHLLIQHAKNVLHYTFGLSTLYCLVIMRALFAYCIS